MRHVPFLLLLPPWDGPVLRPSDSQLHHVTKVLRLRVGAPVEYTDGAGTIGRGVLTPDGVERGEERGVESARDVRIYLAPPKARERQRFAVEKLVELGVCAIGWLETRHGEGRPPPPAKVAAWAQGALEQSRGAWWPTLGRTATPAEVLADGGVMVADRDGERLTHGGDPVTLIVGPEAGWGDGEVPEEAPRVSLGSTVLRTETAAVVGAALLMYD